MDRISKEHRSWNMSRIKGKNTKPELFVRSLFHRMGYRYRLNGKVSIKHHSKGILPGKPDIVLIKYKVVIFVHGCFWHHHCGCKYAYIPKTRTDWWENKFKKTIISDNNSVEKLIKLNFRILVIWECAINSYKNNIDEFKNLLVDFMNSSNNYLEVESIDTN